MRTYSLIPTLCLFACFLWSIPSFGQSYMVDTSWAYNPTYNPSTQNAPQGATTLSLSDDEVSSNIQLGFTFPFFGQDQNQIKISSNGFLGFGISDDGCCAPDSIPNSNAPNHMIAFALGDLNPNLGGTISHQTIGSSPSRKFVVTFDSIQHYGGGFPTTSQIILHEGTGVIEIHTTKLPQDTVGINSDDNKHLMGVENQAGTQGVPYPGRNNTYWSVTNDGGRFIPDSVVSVKEPSLTDAQLKVHPNPSKGPVRVKLDGYQQEVDLNLIGPKGRIIEQYRGVEGKNRFTLNQKDFKGSGIYFLKVISEKGSKIQKIVRTR